MFIPIITSYKCLIKCYIYYNLLLGIYNNYFNNRGACITLDILQPVNYTFNHPLMIFFLNYATFILCL